MNRTTALIAIGIVAVLVSAAAVYTFYPQPKVETIVQNPVAVVHTNYGNFSILLYEDKVKPLTDHFIKYVMSGFYDDMIFHGLLKTTKDVNGVEKPYDGKMIITGKYYENLTEAKPKFQLKWNKRTDTLAGLKHTDLSVSWHLPSNTYGVIGSLWYICDGDFSGRAFHIDENDYVFGKVIKGEQVIRKIGDMQTANLDKNNSDLSAVPVGANNTTVVIDHIDIKRPKSSTESDLIYGISEVMRAQYRVSAKCF